MMRFVGAAVTCVCHWGLGGIIFHNCIRHRQSMQITSGSLITAVSIDVRIWPLVSGHSLPPSPFSLRTKFLCVSAWPGDKLTYVHAQSTECTITQSLDTQTLLISQSKHSKCSTSQSLHLLEEQLGKG